MDDIRKTALELVIGYEKHISIKRLTDDVEGALRAERQRCAKIADEVAEESESKDAPGESYFYGVGNAAEGIAEKIRAGRHEAR